MSDIRGVTPAPAPATPQAEATDLVAEETTPRHDMVKDVLPNVRIHGAERIIQDVHGGIVVHGPR